MLCSHVGVTAFHHHRDRCSVQPFAWSWAHWAQVCCVCGGDLVTALLYYMVSRVFPGSKWVLGAPKKQTVCARSVRARRAVEWLISNWPLCPFAHLTVAYWSDKKTRLSTPVSPPPTTTLLGSRAPELRCRRASRSAVMRAHRWAHLSVKLSLGHQHG